MEEGKEEGEERTDVKVLRKNRGARLADRITTTRRRETETSHDGAFLRNGKSILAGILSRISAKPPQIREAHEGQSAPLTRYSVKHAVPR